MFEEDVRIGFVYRQVVQAFRSIPVDKINEYFQGDNINRFLYDFLDNPETPAIFFREKRGSIEASDVPSPVTSKGGCFYFVKIVKGQVTDSKIAQELLYGDIYTDPLEHLAILAEKIYHPIVGHKATGHVWSEAIAKEVRDNFDTFVANVQITQGHVRGVTCLPIPGAGVSKEEAEGAVTEGANGVQIHALEGAIITWTKQIKNILKQDPENVMQKSNHPGPLAEIEFWTSKAGNLNGIFDQLQSLQVRRVLKILDRSKSTYNQPFAKLCKEVFHARAEANNIVKYLRPLLAWFEGFENETDFEKLVNHFRPIIHLVLLVWKSSAYYNTPARLVVLMREICNTLIRQASDYLNGDTIFELLEAGETVQAVKILQNTLRIFGKFKSTYFDYKAKANVECPDNPWRVQNNAIFVRLDGFLERCHDILDLAQTILQFQKLAKIEVGGTKGKTLTTSVAQIYFDFTQAVENVRSVGKGILDLENKKFDDAFYEFRCRMKELDRRLGSVIIQGFDDASTVAGRFRLLDSFDSLIIRPIIADELEKKHGMMISAVRQDAEEVQKFFNDCRMNPPVGSNLPPIAGALTWCRGLLERIQLPLEKLKSLDRKILEREDARDSVKMYAAFLGQLADFEREKIQDWGQSIEVSSQAKLRNPLLRRDKSNDSPVSLLHVNFDPILVQLLREVKYFLLLGLQVPDTAMDIYQLAEVFRRHTGNLDLIVNMYNDIQTSLLPVERPLVKVQLERIDKMLSQGIGDGKAKGGKGGGLNWKSNGIELFINEAMTEAKEATEVLQVLKGNLKRVKVITEGWAAHPMFERGSKTVSVTDFFGAQKKFRQLCLATIKEGGHECHKLLKDTNKKLKVSQGLPDWKCYIDFVNNMVVAGLINVLISSIKAMALNFTAKHMELNGIPPMLEIQVDLVEQDIVCIPPITNLPDDENIFDPNQMGLHNIVRSWINGMLGMASCFKRLDSSEGSYLRELSDDPQILFQKVRVAKILNEAESNTNKVRRQFRKFEKLWQQDLTTVFADFLKEAVVVEEIEFEQTETEEGKEESTGTDDKKKHNNTWKHTVINLDMFNDRVNYFLEIQSEVQEIKSSYDIDFLKLNTQPVKQAISTWVTKWLYCHTQYLQNYIADILNDLHSFLTTVNLGLEKGVEAGNRNSLMAVMTHIRDVRKRMPEIAVIFDPLRNIVLLLKKYTIPIDLPNIGEHAALDFLESAKMLWDNTVNRAFRVKEEIQPLQNSMLEGIRKEIRAFENQASKFLKEFRQNGPFNWVEMGQLRESYNCIDKYQKQLVDMTSRSHQLHELEDLFELPLSHYSLLDEIREDLRMLKISWDNVWIIQSQFAQWKNTLWADINTDDLIDEVTYLKKQMKNLPKKAKEWNVSKQINRNVSNMAIVLPLIHELHSPAMRERHWKQLCSATQTQFEKGPTFCLDDLLNLNLYHHVDAVLEIVEVANKELKIEARLNTIAEIWKTLELKFDRHRDSEVFVVSPPDDVLDALEEHHLQLQNMGGMGKFVEFFRDAVLEWQTTLGNVETVIKLLLNVQRQWGSLESIFLGSQDIRTQLPDDTKRFESTDSEFKELMVSVQANPNLINCCTDENREPTLLLMHKELEKCEKALNEYLEIKKSIFPRFYFVSNAALLDILSNGNNPAKIMTHIGSVFDGIGNLDLCLTLHQQELIKDDPSCNPGPPEAASAMISKDNEVVKFNANFEMRGAVENWLNELVYFMQETLCAVLMDSVGDAAAWELDKPREEWIFAYPAQICLLTSQIVYTEEVEGALENLESGQEDAMKKYSEVCVSRLEGLIRLVQGQLSKGDRVKIITVITIDVHNRDIVSAMINKRVESNVDFKWQSQLRYMWIPEDKNVVIRICDYSTVYSFEYVGNCGRLVITPLTDRCYVTLTVALRLCLGGAPAGPAGTGKTETTKDLARGLGLPCYVFNCSDQMNYQTMGDIFKGLAQVGAWGCFDEFNRINIEVLSVVASQVRLLLDAVSFHLVPANRSKEYQNLPAGTPPCKVGTFNFFGDVLTLIPTVGLFITMNPGYAGRTELPENLKALFRSCAMIRPDLEPISENMLMAEGFIRAKPLSVKFVTLYRLSSELLSKQHHYDWGLRAVKSVLCVAGILKRANPLLEEEAVMMRALRDFNTPKIPNNDIPIFLRLISDLFPGLDLQTEVSEQLRKTCVEVCKKTGLQAEQSLVTKILQFQELLDVRHSVMLLGPAGCGKTSVWKTLAGCHNEGKPKQVTVFDVVNPKSVTTDELYGYMTLTKDWRDGVISIIMRNMSKNVSPYSAIQTNKWVVLDGDIDSGWIESMNTVMDDNKVLTLVSNERIPLSDAMRMVFEIHSLKNATPATVSRAGILYINDTDIGYLPFIESWLQTKTSEVEKGNTTPLPLPYLFEKYLNGLVEIIHKLSYTVPLPTINLVQTLCYILDGILGSTKAEKNAESVERMFFFAAMWAFGGGLASDKQTDYREDFSKHFKHLAKDIKFPEQGLVFDYVIDFATGDCTPWQDRVSDFSSGDTHSIMVPTVDTARLLYLTNLLVLNNHHVMFVGSAGTGKTILVSEYLSSLVSTQANWQTATINMNFYTDSLALQQQLEQNIDKRSGKNYGPAGKLVYFIDDLNLPLVETYGTQTPMSLMRQHIDHKSWFDRSDVGLKKTISDCQYVCCMNHKSGSFMINPRLQRHFATFTCHMPDEEDLTTIFGTILNNHFYNFPQKIQVYTKNLIAGTIAMHKEMCQKFLPSAIKFHYNFTMRDLASVVKGLTNSRVKEYIMTTQLSRLWYHEVMRVYSDRLVSEAEVQRCRDLAVDCGKRTLDEDDTTFVDPVVFTNFHEHKGDDLGTYVGCQSMAKLKSATEYALSMYNDSNPIMNLVLFEQALIHVTRIARILMFPGGSAMLVGVGGSGKQSLSKLAAFICGYHTVQIAVTSDYSVYDLKEHLKEMYRKAGVKPGDPIMFLLTDSQIIDEHFLVYINDLLSSGSIPDLFTKEEYDGIFASLRNLAKSEGIPDGRDSMMNFFINRVRANLHMVLCFSPVGDSFRQRTRKFPGIISCTSINWFHEWPKDALISVAQRFLEDVDNISRPETKENLAHHMAEVHLSVGRASVEYLKQERRFNYTTPKSFLELIDFFKSLLAVRHGEMLANIRRLDTGLDTLQRTNKDVEHLQVFLIEKKAEVEGKKAATDKLLEEMGQQRAEAQQQQDLADVEKAKADSAALEARKLEEQAEGDLLIARPALDAANDAVNCLDKASMTELKSFSKPPPGVDKVTSALLIMIKDEKKDFSWENAKKMMAKVDAFKEKLETYRGEDIPEDVITRVAPYLEHPDFTFERMKTKSAAAANMCNWVVNIVTFNKIYKRVKPLMDSLEVATASKKKAEEDLAVVEEQLKIIEGKLNVLQASFMEATEEKSKVEREAQDCLDRLSLAERLTTGLASENIRWTATVQDLRKNEETMAGDVMLAASFVSYIGAFGAVFRKELWTDVWLADLVSRDVPLTPNIDPLWVLTNESQVAEWQNQGLPADRISFENGAIMTNCSRWPLLIDPQLQGIRWLKKHEEIRTEKAGRDLIVMSPSGKRWMAQIILAIQNGNTVILENVGENLDSALEPVLNKAVYKKGKSLFIKIGEDDVEYDSNFRLYLQTKYSNPHYKPEIAAQCTLINFIVTKRGLEDQLLAVIVSEEEPDLETTRNELVKAFNDYKVQLKDLEDTLLERLANAPEDILSDIPLIEGLEATKQKASDINEAVVKGKITEVGINEAREVYRVVATEASIIYFVMLQLCTVNHMYQFSLDSFTKFFLKSLKIAVPTSTKSARVENLQKALRWTVFKWVVRGLFEKHRLIFLVQFTFSLMQEGIMGAESGFTQEGMRYLLLGPRAAPDGASPLSWMTDATWAGVRNLSTAIEGFQKLANDVEENGARFLEWFQHYSPELEKLPLDWRELDKTPFTKLLVVRTLRPDRMNAALTNFIRNLIPSGKDFVECDSQLSSFQVLQQSFEDSSPLITIYFILSPGADVVSDVDKLAAKYDKVKGVDYHNISLGQGQDVIAQEKLEIGARQGHWVFLDNVHLMPRWLHTLESKLEEYAETGTHPDFRVMLSSDPSATIPVSILERSIKITSDPPSGLKANLKQAFASFSAEQYDELEPRSKGILFGLCQFHAVLVERKKFGAKGYNMMYPFSTGDLVCSAAVLKNYMESAPQKVPWADLRYLFGEIMYGGHIVNDFDRLLTTTYLEFYMRGDLLDEMSLYPFTDRDTPDCFRAPSTASTYAKVVDHIEDTLKNETPIAFGLHPNAEVGVRTQMSEDLLRIVLELSASTESAGSDGPNSQMVAEVVLQDILDMFRDAMYDTESIAQSLEEVGPFQNVILQECDRTNVLLSEIVRTLIELDYGFKGELSMSDAMEDLANSLFLDRVPKAWEPLAYPSLRSLAAWLADLQNRIAQISEWSSSPQDTPVVTWLSGLFNPQSFLTAVMQSSAQANGLELDKLTLFSEITKKLTAEEITTPAKDGTYISGLSLEGASWNTPQCTIEPSKPREMFCQLPVVLIRPILAEKMETGIFQCPVYKTQQRGPTYVFSLQLRTKVDPGKWVLAGVVSIMDVM